jgi:uncharacterized protein
MPCRRHRALVTRSPPRQPLSDDEYVTLSDLLEARSPFDTDGLLGALHAVAVAPSMVPSSAWLRVVLPDGFGDVDAAGAEPLLGLVFRLFNEVLDSVNRGAAFLMPEEDDLDGCSSFAAGFAAGAEIDTLWIGDDHRWTFASWAAYLGNRLDLVPQHTLAKLDAIVDARQTLRRDMPGIINAAHDSFTKLRRAAPTKHPTQNHHRVGRNDPCTCGSGKKFKRCCIDQKPALGSH